MLGVWLLVVCLSTEVLGHGSSSHRQPRTRWTLRGPEGIPRGQGSSPKSPEGNFEEPNYLPSSQGYWRSGLVNSSLIGQSSHLYARPYFGSSGGGGGLPFQDSTRGSHSSFPYQQMRLATGNPVSVKKMVARHPMSKLQTQAYDVSGKYKIKKAASYQSPAYPRVHKPYAKHKYPIQKTNHPFYGLYHQSPYQRYVIPSSEMLRHKSKTRTVPPTSSSDKYHTTERMDDVYPEGSSTSEDYFNYNDTHGKSGGTYYETYEEVDKPLIEEESSPDETTTRGYYGDRIYMSTQVSPAPSEKTTLEHRYYIVRRISDDNDIETIFE